MTPESAPGWLHLGEDETVVWHSRPHPITMGAGLPAGVALALVGFLLAGWGSTGDGSTLLVALGVLCVLAGAALALAQYVVWTNTRYVLTSAELYKKHGVVSRDVTQFRLDRIQNTSLRQSPIGRLLGYGELTVYTAGSGEPELTFERVPRPERANNALSMQLEAAVNRQSANRR
ncbi:PH domain-containing protein [Natrononativus amylolyticus]|uniref:PH domain-containing protein n=1 Tax=Natrononativus amylolyticus TaxID=2963434 RepID=UPI0020CF44FB|nr:PH domain-containing protein [Natrononativus amylolyticus]